MPHDISRRRFVTGTIRLAVVSPLVSVEQLASPRRRSSRLAAAERRTLRAAVDVIVPAAGRMPAASAVGAVGYIERASGNDRAIREQILRALHAIDAGSRAASGRAFAVADVRQQTAVLTQLENSVADMPLFAVLRDFTYEAYYTHPRIWKLLGYKFRNGRRRTAQLEPFDEAVLSRVRAMPRFYRET